MKQQDHEEEEEQQQQRGRRRCRQGRGRLRVCLFGTSANPPTGEGGHTGIVRILSEMKINNEEEPPSNQDNEDVQDDDKNSSSSNNNNDEAGEGPWAFHEIRVLPVYQHTFSAKRNSLASYRNRMELCRLSFQNIPRVHISDAEERSFLRKVAHLQQAEENKNRRNQDPNLYEGLRVGTADLLEMLMEEEPYVDFTFCLGTDTFIDLTDWKWRRSKEVLKLLNGRIVVLYRKGMTNDDELHDRIRTVNANEGNGNILLLEHIPTLRSISSSWVRSCTEDTLLEQLVTPEVLDYMRQNNLYSFGDGNTSEPSSMSDRN